MSEGPGDPLTALALEHAEFIEKLNEFEAALDGMMATRHATDAELELCDEAVRFFEDDLLPHFDREDRHLLPALEAKVGRFGSLVNVIAYEHEEVRREIGKIKESLAALKAKRGVPHIREVEELNRHGIFTVQFLWDHFRKEKQSLFPTAREELSLAELEALGPALTPSAGSGRGPAPR